ncbi:MAG: hypothetical protein JNL98_32415 [Bryobacterales bacterium]|nr:hypothetical protein [Bryobacterales bacterium]
MTQTQRELTTHFGFQMSLLRLSTIPGPNGRPVPETVKEEAAKLEALAESIQLRKQ